MLREGSGTPLVLLHGVLGSETMWERVLPLVSPYHDTIAPTALGHRGGRSPGERPVRFSHVIDDAARTLDELGIDRAHLAGNSMGGWVALELARRGRALSVCALSPAGCWPPIAGGKQRAARSLESTMFQARAGRPLLPLLARSPAFRRWAMRLNAAHGDRLTPNEVVKLADDLLGCTAGADLLGTKELVPLLDPPPCPITLAWSEKDRVFPVRFYAPLARERVPGATYRVLEDVGHVPMLDAPELVARTILECTGARPAARAGQGPAEQLQY
jgi:pimeloyl-ACP methyl ester carboxylesterase